jgi:hypothetical protein
MDFQITSEKFRQLVENALEAIRGKHKFTVGNTCENLAKE